MMYKKYFIVTILIALLLGCASFEEAINFGSLEVKNDDIHMKVAFNDHDIKTIKEYYSKGKKSNKKMPPGLAKKDKFPPGLQKQLERNQKLPPGLEKRNLPSDLERELTALPQAYVRVKVGADVMIMNRKTEVIVDIIYSVDS